MGDLLVALLLALIAYGISHAIYKLLYLHDSVMLGSIMILVSLCVPTILIKCVTHALGDEMWWRIGLGDVFIAIILGIVIAVLRFLFGSDNRRFRNL